MADASTDDGIERLVVEVSTLEAFVHDANSESRWVGRLVARTREPEFVYPLLPPLRTYSWREREDGAREMMARTALHGPAPILVVWPLSRFLARVEAADPHPEAVAPRASPATVMEELADELARLAARQGLSPYERLRFLGRLVEGAAILLLDDRAAEHAAEARLYRRRAAIHYAGTDLLDVAHHGGAPGLGRRA